MRKLTQEQLEAFSAKKALISAEERLVAVSDGVLVEFLGAKWVERHVYAGASDPFLRVNHPAVPDRFKHHDRVTGLAEMLFNLQDVQGMEHRIAQIRTAGDVESGFAELEAARFFRLCNMPFSFREPSGVKGSDYDLDFILPSGVPGASESKCKLEATQRSVETVADAVRKARAQLPTDRIGVVVLKIPEGWRESGLGGMMEVGIDAGWLGSGRIACVLVLWEEWQLGSAGARKHARYRHELNPRARIQDATLVAGFTPDRTNDNWYSLGDLAGVGRWYGSAPPPPFDL